MIDSPKQSQDLSLKQEEVVHHHHHEEEEKAKASSSSNSSQWLRLKDPRIVRVSRAFGGKDRHSKVCTVRGLRDRRVRLSVPTAIQLYDLQDRLGLNQPSKVVDWLLNAAKNEIDELPPLPNFNIIPQLQGNNNNNTNNYNSNYTLGGFPFQSSMMMINNNASNVDEQVFNNRGIIHHQLGEGTSKPREDVVEEKSNWMVNKSSTNEEKEEDNNKEGANFLGGTHSNNNTNSVLPIIRPNHHHHHPSFLGLLNTMPIGNYQWETTTSSGDNVVGAHQLGNHNVGFTNQTDYLHHYHHGINVVPFPSTLSLLSSGSSSSNNNNNNNSNLHQILVCPPPLPHGSTQSYFPSSSNNVTAAAMELMDPRQINHYQMLTSQNLLTTSNSPNHPSFSLAMMTPRLLNSPNTRERPSHHKEHDFPSK